MSQGVVTLNWIDAGALTSFPVGEIIALELNGHSIIVIHWSDRYFCYTDACSHQPVKLSDFGLLAPEGILMCQAHGACFDVTKSGRALCFPAQRDLEAWETRVVGSNLQVLLKL